MGIDYRIGGLIMGSKRSVFYAYIHESSTQDAPALRTRDGGLKIFYDRSTLLTHPVPQTLMHNDIFLVNIPWALLRAGSLQNCGSARQLLFKKDCCNF